MDRKDSIYWNADFDYKVGINNEVFCQCVKPVNADV